MIDGSSSILADEGRHQGMMAFSMTPSSSDIHPADGVWVSASVRGPGRETEAELQQLSILRTGRARRGLISGGVCHTLLVPWCVAQPRSPASDADAPRAFRRWNVADRRGRERTRSDARWGVQEVQVIRCRVRRRWLCLAPFAVPSFAQVTNEKSSSLPRRSGPSPRAISSRELEREVSGEHLLH